MVRLVQAARFWQVILFKAILQVLAISRALIHIEGLHGFSETAPTSFVFPHVCDQIRYNSTR